MKRDPLATLVALKPSRSADELWAQRAATTVLPRILDTPHDGAVHGAHGARGDVATRASAGATTDPEGGRSGAGGQRSRLHPALAAAAAVAAVVTLTLTAVELSTGDDDSTRPSAPVPPVPSVSSRSEPDGLEGMDLSAVSEAQAAEVSDRVVTAEEYRAAFDRYRDCMSDAGFELQDPLMIDGVYSSPISVEAKESGVFDECYELEYRYTDRLWQWSPAVRDQSSTTELLRDCLRERGVEPSDTRDGVDEQISSEGIDVLDCLP